MAHDGAAARAAAWAALGAAFLWFAWPVLTCVHVEGFTASIGSIALHLTHDRLENYDRLFPFNLQFFAFSRLGANLFVAGLVGPLGLPAELALRITMWTGLALLTGATFVLARAWSSAPPLAIAAVMVLTPGLVETGYYFNDNLLSAGVGATALALLVRAKGPLATIASGVLFGFAVLARTDCVLLAPAAGLVLLEREGLRRGLALHAALFGAAALALAAGVLAAFGLTPLTVLRIASHAVALWARNTDWMVQPVQIVVFAGPVTLDLAALGAFALARERKVLRLALLVGTLVVYNLVYLNKVWVGRQLAPLTPFLVALAATGLQAVIALKTPIGRALGACLALLVLFNLAAPPPAPLIWEGPRMSRGRLWTPPVWRAWQRAVQTGYDGIGALVARPPAPVTAVITDYWDADRYAHLQLQEHGYRPIAPALAGPACPGVGELFARGGTRVLHIRLHTPFLADWPMRLAPRFEGPARACLEAAHPGAEVYVASLARIDHLAPGPDTAWIAADRRAAAAGRAWFAEGDLDPQAGRRLSAQAAARLPAVFRADAAALLARSTPAQRAHILAPSVDPTLSAVR